MRAILGAVDNSFLHLPLAIFVADKAERVQCSNLHKRLITQSDAKIAMALMFRNNGMPFLQEQKTARVGPKKALLRVTRRSFRMTKLLFSRLDWRFFRLQQVQK